MKMILLQIPAEQVGTGVSTIYQYGAIGVMLVFVLIALIYMERQRTKTADEGKLDKQQLVERVVKLEERQSECEKRHENFLMNEYAKSNVMIEKCTDILEEVKKILIKNA